MNPKANINIKARKGTFASERLQYDSDSIETTIDVKENMKFEGE